MGDIATYFKRSPDPLKPSCMVTKKLEDGVVFANIEPIDATMCFIGRTAIYEAIVAMYPELTPLKVKRLLEGASTERELKAELKAVNARLARYQKVIDALNETGLIVPDLE